MPFTGTLLLRRPKAVAGGDLPISDGAGILPFIGVADWSAPRTQETIENMAQLQRGPNPSRVIPPFTLDAGNEMDAYWVAYPVSYGMPSIKMLNDDYTDAWDIGWEGAHGNPIEGGGPMEIEMIIDGYRVPFYVFVSDWPGTGVGHYRFF